MFSHRTPTSSRPWRVLDLSASAAAAKPSPAEGLPDTAPHSPHIMFRRISCSRTPQVAQVLLLVLYVEGNQS